MVPGVRVTGVVDLPASPAAPTQKLQRGVLRGSVQLTPVDPSRGMQAFASIDEQGRFAIESVLPGLYRLKVITGLGYVASAVSGTQDLLHGDLEIASGTPPPELEIRVRADAANLTARAPQESGWMLLTRPGGEYIEFTQSFRSAGHFVRIAPGDYVVYFIPKIETLEYRNPAIIHALRGGVSVTLAPGADQTIDIQEVAR